MRLDKFGSGVTLVIMSEHNTFPDDLRARCLESMDTLRMARERMHETQREHERVRGEIGRWVRDENLAQRLSDLFGMEVTKQAAETLVTTGELRNLERICEDMKKLRVLFGTLPVMRMTWRGGTGEVWIEAMVPDCVAEEAQDTVRAMDLLIPVEVNP